MWDTIRYRRLQAVAIALLAALVTACAVFAPLYDRATQQALTRILLDRASVMTRGLTVTAGSDAATAPTTPDPVGVAASVPKALRASFAAPIYAHSAQPRATSPTTSLPLEGTVAWRANQCDHLTITQGRCPTRVGDIAVSTADARILGLVPGTPVRAVGLPPDPSVKTDAPTTTFSVVGVYQQVAGPYWFGQSLTGRSGIEVGGSTRSLEHDVWVTASPTFASGDLPTLPQDQSSVSYPLEPTAVGVDQLLQMGAQVDRLDKRFRSDLGYTDDDYRLYSGLPDIADNVRHQRDQSRVTIPLLTVQLGLLAVVVLWLVLGAAVEQRRPEVAVAVLRGRGRSGAGFLLMRELLPLTLAGVPVGVVVALAVNWATRILLLPGSMPFEVRWPEVLAAVGSVVVLGLATLLAVLSVSRSRVEQLLRRVAQRRSGWSFGVLETLLLAAAGTAVVAFVTGGLNGPIALAAPALLALVVGLLLAHATTPVSTVLGHRLLRRGRVAAGISVLDAARTPATRRTVAIVTVSASLLVFASVAVLVGARNRALAADQEAGAPLTAEIFSNRPSAVQDVREALHSVDPSGRRVTPVVSVFPAASGAQQTMAVLPDGFRHVARFAGLTSAPDLGALAAPTAAPIRLRGDTMTLSVLADPFQSVSKGKGATPPVTLELDLADAAGDVLDVDLGRLTAGAPSQVTRPISCSQGCNLVGITVVTIPTASASGTVTLSDLQTTTGGAAPTPVPLGPTHAWTPLTGGAGELRPTSTDGSSLSVAVETNGHNRTTMSQAWLPQRVPVLTTHGRVSSIIGLAGEERGARYAGHLSRVPRGSPDTALVNLGVVTRGASLDPTDRIEVWFDHDDPALFSRVERALQTHGLQVSSHQSLADVRRGFDQSTTAWSLALGVVVGAAALLLGLLVVVVMAVTTWRSRSRDLAALRLAGLPRRTARSVATLAQVPALVLAVIAGAACGVLGARLTLPTLPLFAHHPAVSTLDLGLPWLAVVVVAVVALALLVATGWLAGSAIAHRADLQRVRETL